MDGPARFRFGDFELDTTRFKLLRDGRIIPIEPKALDLLRLLLDRSPRIVEKAVIFDVIWRGVAVTDNALTRLVAQLRRALEDDPKAPRYIETIATRGYRFVAPATVLPPDDPAREPAPSANDAIATPTAVAPVAPPRPPADAHGAMTRLRPVAAIVAILLAGGSVLLGARFLGIRADRSAAARVRGAGGSDEILKRAALRPREVTTGTGFDGYLAYAPDGRSIAFASDRSGSLEICVQDLAPGSIAAPITSNGRQNVQPAWSPDGTLIAYHEMAGNGIWIVPSRGGVARRVSDFGAHPSWSPDGRRIAFQSLPLVDVNPLRTPGALSTIWIVDADGRGEPGALTTAGDPAGPHLAPVWRPRTNQVLFTVPASPASVEGTALWSVDVDVRTSERLAIDERLSADYALAPNGDGLYFVARGTNAIWWLPLDEHGETAEPLPTGLPAVASMSANLTISPDGRHLAWTALDSTTHIWSVDAPASGTAQEPPIALTRGIGVHYGSPAPSGDGRIAFSASRHGSAPSLFLLSPGSSMRQMTIDASGHHGPQWLPGRAEVALVADHGEGPAFWSVDVATGRERMLFRLADLPRVPGDSQPSTATPAANIAFAPDFNRLAMSVVRGGVANVWIAPLERSRPVGPLVQRTFERSAGTYPVWSPDGRWIAYQCGERTNTHVCAIDAAGGRRVQLTSEAGQSWIGGWAPDSDTIVFAARRGGIWNVATVSKSTRAVRTLTRFTEPRIYVRYPRWDGAAGRVLFERSQLVPWMMTCTSPGARRPDGKARRASLLGISER